MRRILAAAILAGLPALGHAHAALSATQSLCEAALAGAERAETLPERVLRAIGRVESGRRDPGSQTYGAWPWTVNAEGTGYFYETKADAVAAVRDFQARGMRSIDVGCAQVNLMHHKDAFASLEQAFDPAINAAYAGRFLKSLFQQTGTWPKAVAGYHSMTPELGDPYAKKVYAALDQEDGSSAATATARPSPALPAPVGAFGAAYPPGRLAVTIPSGAGELRVMPLTAAAPAFAAGAMTGRGLDAYRAAPIRLARGY